MLEVKEVKHGKHDDETQVETRGPARSGGDGSVAFRTGCWSIRHRVNMFARPPENTSGIHVDVERANAEIGGGGPIATATGTLSLSRFLGKGIAMRLRA